MQDTGLNILAIAIFSLTLSVLLGPLLNISPAIPASLTFVMLGLITIDTLSWKNQGVNLLLNIFASSEQKERIIYHEAGHFLTAYLYQIPIIDYSLSAWEAIKKKNTGSGGVIFDDSFLKEKSLDLKEFNLIIERFGVVLMAGIAAEKLIYNHSEGGQDDQQKFQEIYSNLTLTYSNFQVKQRLAILQATSMIEKNKESYLALVEAMKKRQSVTECQAIIQKTLNIT
ncbi:ATP-dependent Zn protease [Geminocystis sp. GBBB08]|uniref:ATP-dependent Zn protease n=1 Tax=Geminocystis sp. GBBB08 TaxID=2604140 RepID=UPI0027E3810E|nr:ATP-dependent Zn protease [Geminocystis sp. GBBB08]MBL1210570.1 ATP-dependent Zn protease [Geminocystis sp. GBBB08]